MNKQSTILSASVLASVLAGAVSAQAQAAAPAPVVSQWESSAAAGLTLTRGNSSTLIGNLSLQTARKWDQNELGFGASGTYGKNAGVKNAENAQAYGFWNRLLSERAYVGVRLDAYHDAIADIKYRFTLSPLAGYYFIKNDTTRLAGEAGPSFIYQNQGGQKRGYIAARVAERFEHKFSDTAKMWQSAEFLVQVDRLKKYLINFEIGAEAALTKSLSLRSYVQDNFDNVPAPGRKKNDIRWVTAVAYKF